MQGSMSQSYLCVARTVAWRKGTTWQLPWVSRTRERTCRSPRDTHCFPLEQTSSKVRHAASSHYEDNLLLCCVSGAPGRMCNCNGNPNITIPGPVAWYLKQLLTLAHDAIPPALLCNFSSPSATQEEQGSSGGTGETEGTCVHAVISAFAFRQWPLHQTTVW